MSFLSDCRETWNRRKDVMTFSMGVVMKGIYIYKIHIFRKNHKQDES